MSAYKGYFLSCIVKGNSKRWHAFNEAGDQLTSSLGYRSRAAVRRWCDAQVADKPACTPGWCGLGHGAKCFNAGRCLRGTVRALRPRSGRAAATGRPFHSHPW